MQVNATIQNAIVSFSYKSNYIPIPKRYMNDFQKGETILNVLKLIKKIVKIVDLTRDSCQGI